MNKTKIMQSFIGSAVVGAMFLTAALPAFAEMRPGEVQEPGLRGEVRTEVAGGLERPERRPPLGMMASSTASTTRAALRLDKKMAKNVERANQEIDRRIESLTRLSTRVGKMHRESEDGKVAVSADVQAQIDSLNALRGKIGSDGDLETLKADVKSITDSYRVFALVIPKGTVLAASDRVTTVAATLTVLVTKLQTRITGAQTSGKDVTALTAALTDLDAKVADALSQAGIAKAGVSALVPDNGDATVAAANKKALQDAKANIKNAEDDFKAARKDAETIARGLRAFSANVSNENATSTASTTDQH